MKLIDADLKAEIDRVAIELAQEAVRDGVCKEGDELGFAESFKYGVMQGFERAEKRLNNLGD